MLLPPGAGYETLWYRTAAVVDLSAGDETLTRCEFTLAAQA